MSANQSMYHGPMATMASKKPCRYGNRCYFKDTQYGCRFYHGPSAVLQGTVCTGCESYEQCLDIYASKHKLVKFLALPEDWKVYSRYQDAPFDVYTGGAWCYYLANPMCSKCSSNVSSTGTRQHIGYSIGDALEKETMNMKSLEHRYNEKEEKRERKKREEFMGKQSVYHSLESDKKIVDAKYLGFPCHGCKSFDAKLDSFASRSTLSKYSGDLPSGWMVRSHYVESPFDDYAGTWCYFLSNPKCSICKRIKLPEIREHNGHTIGSALWSEKREKELKIHEKNLARALKEQNERKNFYKECEDAMKKWILGSRMRAEKKYTENQTSCPCCANGTYKYRNFHKFSGSVSEVRMYNYTITQSKADSSQTQRWFCLYSEACKDCLQRKNQMLDVVDVV